MINRYISAAAAGIAVTTALLWVMHILIEVGEAAVVDSGAPHRLVLGRTIVERPVSVDDPEPPVAPVPPVNPPPLVPPTDIDPKGRTTPIPRGLVTPPGPSDTHTLPGYADSAFINIINAQPDYPQIASQKGMEGHVLVQFDVTEIGTVENVVVIKTSSPVFNKAAIKAAYRSRYKAKTVDGVTQRTQGLRKLFRFEMET